MDWDAPAIVLDARPYGEGDAIATVMTAEHGAHRGLARGGTARGRTAIWQPGNLIQARWVARLSEQLGSFAAELVHPAAALAMDDALALAMLSSVCAVAEGALPEREPHPRVFEGLLHLIAHLSQGQAILGAAICQPGRPEAERLHLPGSGEHRIHSGNAVDDDAYTVEISARYRFATPMSIRHQWRRAGRWWETR